MKIDRAFVRDTPDDPEDCAIATAIVALAHCLKRKVVAEGVETTEQLTFLRGLGCDEIQGYLISPPLPASQLIPWLENRCSQGDSPEISFECNTDDGMLQAADLPRTQLVAGALTG